MEETTEYFNLLKTQHEEASSFLLPNSSVSAVIEVQYDMQGIG